MKYTKVVAALLSLVVWSALAPPAQAAAAPLKKPAQAAKKRPARKPARPAPQAAQPATQNAAGAAAERFLPELRSRAEFDRMARVYTDQPYALPHVIFVIDRKDGNKIYYANSKRYRFHVDFVNGNYLSLERGDTFFKNNYVSENRR